MKRRRVYGPVPSRRLGLSLGVDVIPRKVCCFDCSYCQVGPTTRRTIERKSFIDVAEVVEEISAALSTGPAPEVITLAGSGEPTLCRNLGELQRSIKAISSLPVALLTNGALLGEESVREEVSGFELVLPSLDAADESIFARINRPTQGLTLRQVVEGLHRFTHGYRGICRLEIMLVKGINDTPESLEALSRVARTLRIDSVDLNTVIRPAAHGALPLGAAEMERALLFFEGLPARIIAEFRSEVRPQGSETGELRQRIVETLARRPCTLDDLCRSLGRSAVEVAAICDQAQCEGLIEERPGGEGQRYFAVSKRSAS
jgi:wyosine [tRNA(Phe)-imidazoG37] synthetase (radical SAM superfamily)